MPFGDGVERPKTLVFSVPVQLRDGFKEEFLAKLVSTLQGHDLLSVQFVPNFYVRVTFRRLESRRSVFHEGLWIDGVEIPLLEADSSFRHVYIHHCPYKVLDVLADYGSVQGVVHPCFPGSTMYTGTWIVKMSLESAVPAKLYILRYLCRVWYRDQPQECRICESVSHHAANCPLRGLCRKCRQPGHFERNCPGIPPPADAAPPAADTVATDVPPASSADDVMGDIDLASGDEEVLAAAGHVSLSPRR